MSIMEMNAEKYREFIQSDKPVLVEFSAPWCGYCRRLAPVIEAVAEEYKDTIPFGGVNIDEEPELTDSEKIKLVPTLRIYKNGKILSSIIAPDSKARLELFIKETIHPQEHKTNATKHVYDMIVVGGGPGGYTAALYAARAGLDIVVLEKLSAGGQMSLSDNVENYPGFEEGIAGFMLGEKMKQQAERFGVETKLTEVLSLELPDPVKKVKTSDGVLYAKTIVLATGASPRKLGVPGEHQLTGKGVNYCASCDGMFYKDKTVVIVGGGNSAATEASILSRICKKVYLVHRRDTLRATKVYQEPLMKKENVEFCWDSAVKELLHDERLTGVVVQNVKTGEERTIDCEGMFVSIGRKPSTELVKGQLKIDPAGYVDADETTRTNIPGVFAVGDVRRKAVHQIVTAVADGAVAIHYAEEYLRVNMLHEK